MTLNEAWLKQQLPHNELFLFEEIDSTNEFLLQHKHLANGSLCLAKTQTAGRGRRGRKWHSGNEQNLYFSLLWHYPLKAISSTDLSALSLAVAVVIAESLASLNVPDIQIKWPNDLYFQGKKMGGILIESVTHQDSLSLVIGIGLNLKMPQEAEEINQPCSALENYALDRNALIVRLSQGLQQLLADYTTQGFSAYITRWQALDLFKGEKVKLITENATFHGISQGVNEQGELLLQSEAGIKSFAIGEISLRSDRLSD